MSQNSIQRPALGQYVDLGTLYDARTDTFVERSLLNDQLPETTVSLQEHSTSQLRLLSDDSYKMNFNDLNIGPELGASFLAGMVNVSRAAEYLQDERSSATIDQASIHYTITTAEERLCFGQAELTPCINLDSIQDSGATHVLAAIVWGGQTIVTAKYQVSETADRKDHTDYLNHEFNRIDRIVQSKGNHHFPSEPSLQKKDLNLEITVYSDVLQKTKYKTDLHPALDFLLELPARTATINEGQGFPLNYTLVPLELLTFLLNVDVKADVVFTQPGLNCLEWLPPFYDEMRESQRRLHDFDSELSTHPHCVPQDLIQAISRCMTEVGTTEKRLHSDLGPLLQATRATLVDQSELARLLENSRRRLPSLEDITSKAKQYQDKITFVNSLLSVGINYIGYGAEPIEKQLRANEVGDAFVLFFHKNLRQKSESWDENYRFFQKLRKSNGSGSVFAIVDCGATGTTEEAVRVSRFQEGQIVIADVLDQVKYGKCYVRCINEEQLDTADAKEPLRRSAVVISCPGPNCDQGAAHEWVCQRCNAPIEYGAADQYVYCDCGRSAYGNYGFRCKELEHGPLFEAYERGALLQMLNSLDPMDELNVLIIGETGVGKSTFINAFINYLSYSTLDEALANDSLDYVIPCSFNYQTMDRSNPNGSIVQKEIQVGRDSNENNGSGGESATQSTMVYPVTLGDTVIRLIDTPGIGATRGVEKDKENMQNILGMLSNFEKLHGILFLLKSNSARLTLMFRFVMEKLLTHLHRDATLNMVFGFTNTRISNYMPGDTFTPLKNLLKKHTRVDIGLNPRTVYCFDSESFRFLVAEKMGTTMENIQDFRLSWEKSEYETKRLIEHFRSLVPHAVRSTLSLNQTRDLILHLTKPMADIMQTIERTIRIGVDNMEELKDTRLKGDQLRQKLHWEKLELVHHTLDHPRTVCNDVECKEYRDDGEGNKQTIYKSHCHPRYWLTLPIGTLSVAEMMKCAAFDGKEHCTKCTHHWENHLHVSHELEEQMKTVQDEAIVEQLTKNAGDITLKETAIQNVKNRITESDYEYNEIQDAAVRFGIFLQKHSITPYNDATEEYLWHLIKEEKGKVSVGGRQNRLESLEQHLNEHVEQRKILKDNISSGTGDELVDEAGVEDLVEHLYNLKHWGKNLRDIKNKAEAECLAEYREKPYRPGKNSRNSSNTTKDRMTGALNWLAGRGMPGSAMLDQRKRSTRVAAPYQSRSTMVQRPPVPAAYYQPRSSVLQKPPPVSRGHTPGAYNIPGAYIEEDTAAWSQRQMQQGLRTPQEPPRSHPAPSASYIYDQTKQDKKGKSLAQRLLRPFTKRH